MDIGSLTGQIALEDQLTDKLTLMADHVKKFAEDFDGAFGAIAIGVGAVTAAIAGAVISVTALGEKGSTILGVESAFDRLAKTVGSTGDAMITKLSAGVRGTVDSMELMQSVNRALTAGVKLTADDMASLGEAARAMGKATGTDAADGLRTLSSALATGRTRGLSMAGIMVDLKKGHQEYATSIGLVASELTTAQNLEADRIAILEATRSYVDRLGVSQLSFKEKLQQTSVAIGNWFDNLAKGVAASPNVSRAFDSIQTAVVRAFGGDSQRMLDTIVGWVNSFADAVSQYGPPIIQTIADIWHEVLTLWHTVQEAWDIVPDWFKNIARDAGLAAGAVYLTSNAFGALGGSSLLSTVASFATITSGAVSLTQILKALTPGIVSGTAAWIALQVELGTTAGMIAGILLPFAQIAIPIAAVTAVLTLGWQAWKLWGEDAERAAAQAKQLPIDMSNLAIINKELGTSFTNLDTAMKEWYKRKADVVHFTDSVQALTVEESAAAQAAEAYNLKVQNLIGSLRTAARDIFVARDAFGQLGTKIFESVESSQAFTTAMDKIVASGRELTTIEKAKYDVITATRLKVVEQSEAMLILHGVSLQMIEADRALGMTQQEMANKYNTTTEALTKYGGELTKIKTLDQRLSDLSGERTGTSQQNETAKLELEFQTQVALLDKQSPLYMTLYDKLARVRAKAIESQGMDYKTMISQTRQATQEIADLEMKKYDYMTSRSQEYSRDVLDAQRTKMWEARDAVRDFGIGATSSFSAVAEAAKLANAEIMKLNKTVDSSRELYQMTFKTLDEVMAAQGLTPEVRAQLISYFENQNKEKSSQLGTTKSSDTSRSADVYINPAAVEASGAAAASVGSGVNNFYIQSHSPREVAKEVITELNRTLRPQRKWAMA